jgi:hypothetical protein
MRYRAAHPKLKSAPRETLPPFAPGVKPECCGCEIRAACATFEQDAVNRAKMNTHRHCERSEAIQSRLPGSLDCFVATLLAMTVLAELPDQHSRKRSKSRLPALHSW